MSKIARFRRCRVSYLNIIINWSLSESKFPSLLKWANVTPIHKGGSRPVKSHASCVRHTHLHVISRSHACISKSHAFAPRMLLVILAPFYTIYNTIQYNTIYNTIQYNTTSKMMMGICSDSPLPIVGVARGWPTRLCDASMLAPLEHPPPV